MDTPVTDNAEKNRYELTIDGHTAFADYQQEGTIRTISYVYAPNELRGTGAASRLMHGVMEHLAVQNLKAHPTCGYAVSWLKKHKEYAALTA